jgi:hypothetical protein
MGQLPRLLCTSGSISGPALVSFAAMHALVRYFFK